MRLALGQEGDTGSTLDSATKSSDRSNFEEVLVFVYVSVPDKPEEQNVDRRFLNMRHIA